MVENFVCSLAPSSDIYQPYTDRLRAGNTRYPMGKVLIQFVSSLFPALTAATHRHQQIRKGKHELYTNGNPVLGSRHSRREAAKEEGWLIVQLVIDFCQNFAGNENK